MPVTDCDYLFGFNHEQMEKENLEKFFGVTLKMTSKYHIFDYIGKNIAIELKTRRCAKDDYPTTMIPLHKINRAKRYIKKQINVFFCFKFNCGNIYYYEYTDKSDDEIVFKIGGRNDRGQPEYNMYGYIPIDKLDCINTLNLSA